MQHEAWARDRAEAWWQVEQLHVDVSLWAAIALLVGIVLEWVALIPMAMVVWCAVRMMRAAVAAAMAVRESDGASTVHGDQSGAGLEA